jgi:hypothetical protein
VITGGLFDFAQYSGLVFARGSFLQLLAGHAARG